MDTDDVIDPPPPSTEDALALLRGDHRRIEALLGQCLQSAEPGAAVAADRSGVLARLSTQLSAHMKIEQELFYPALAGAPKIGRPAVAEHAEIEARLKTLATLDLNGEDFAERLASLAELVRDHFEHEEAELFSAAKSLDLQDLGTRLATRRGELLGDMGMD